MRYFIFRNFCFTSCFTAILLTVTADRIARLLKVFGAIQTVVLDISKEFYRVLYTGFLYKFRLYGVIKRCFITLSHFILLKDFKRHLLSVPLMLEWLRTSFALNEQKKIK